MSIYSLTTNSTIGSYAIFQINPNKSTCTLTGSLEKPDEYFKDYWYYLPLATGDTVLKIEVVEVIEIRIFGFFLVLSGCKQVQYYWYRCTIVHSAG